MKKFFAILFLAVLMTGCSNQSRLVIYTSNLRFANGMFPPEVLTGFENETGIRIRHVNFDTNETMQARLRSARGGRYDLVIADDYILENVISQGLAKKLDRSRLSNFSNINPLYQGRFYDPGDEYTIPYGASVQTIIYNPEGINIPVRSYLDLWHPNLRQRIGIIDSFRIINGMALRVMGHSYNITDLSIIQEAGSFLNMLAPNIRFIRDDGLENELVSGEIQVAVMYTPQVITAKTARPDLKVVFPSEGTGFNIMAAFIPSRASNADAAYAFIDYILDAKRGAQCFEYLGYFSTFSASEPYILEEFRELLTLPVEYNRPGVMEMIQNISPEAEAMHNNVWSEFKSTIRH